MYLNKRSPSNLGSYVTGIRSPANLGFFRPNQAYDRGIYGLGRSYPPPRSRRMVTISGLGCDGCKTPTRRGMSGRDRRRGGMGDDTNFLAAGSTLSYSAQWPTLGANGQTSFFVSGSGIVSSISQTLAQQWGITIVSEFDNCNFLNCGGFTLQIQTTRDYGTAADVKSILDSVVGSAVGNPGMVGQGYGSNISVVQSVSTPNATGAATSPTSVANAAIITQYQQAIAAGDTATAQTLASAYPSILTAFTGAAAAASLSSNPLGWLSQNWQWLAIGAVGVVLVPKLL